MMSRTATTTWQRQPDDVPDEAQVRRGALAGAPSRRITRQVVGVLLVCVAVYGVTAKFRSAGDRVAVLVLARHVAEGTVIGEGDLTEALIAPDNRLSSVRSSERSRFVGRIAATDLLPGTNVTEASVSREPAVPAGRVLVGVALRDGRFPTGLRVGDEVDVLRVASRNVEEAETAVVVARGAIVRSVDAQDGGLGLTRIDLVVASADVAAAAAASAQDSVALVRPGPRP